MAYPRIRIFLIFALIGPLVGGAIPFAISVYQIASSPVRTHPAASLLILGLSYLFGGVQAMVTGAAAASSYDEDDRTIDPRSIIFVAGVCAIFAVLPMVRGRPDALPLLAAFGVSIAVHLSAALACIQISWLTIAERAARAAASGKSK